MHLNFYLFGNKKISENDKFGTENITNIPIFVSSDSGSIQTNSITSIPLFVSSDSGNIQTETITNIPFIVSGSSDITVKEDINSETITNIPIFVSSDSGNIQTNSIINIPLFVRSDSGCVQTNSIINIPLAISSNGGDIQKDITVNIPLIVSGKDIRSYAVWNHAIKGSNSILTNGNLTAYISGANSNARSTVAVSSGKWYWEITSFNTARPRIGVGNPVCSPYTSIGDNEYTWAYNGADGQKYHDTVAQPYALAWDPTKGIFSPGTIGVALDADIGSIELFRDGVSLGVMYTNMTGPYLAMVCGYQGSTDVVDATANFGATPFSFIPPTGYNPGLFN